MKIDSQQLKAFLLSSNLVDSEKIESVSKRAKKKRQSLEKVLIDEGIVSAEKLIRIKAYILGIPFVNLEKEIIDKKILNIIPEPVARAHNIIAFAKNGQEIRVAMLDPEDLQTIEFIKKKTGLKILPSLTTPESIKHILKQYQKSLEVEFGEIITESASKVVRGGSLKKMAHDLPIIKIVDTFLKHAILQGASDIHIEPQEKEIIIRYRIDGILHDAMTLPRQVLDGIVARIKVLANLKLDEHRLPQDGRFKIETSDYKIAFRVSVLPVFDGEKIVMRLLDESSSRGLTLEGLGFWGDALEIVHHNIKKPNGMILVTGPTGSGKTTTLYTIMDILNTPGVNINTIEDPIEYRMNRINQTQVRPKIGLTFASGLRALVRQDPDIIMVGEIRDKETASLAVHAALTGHLVLSTLHTNSAAGTIPRLLDMGQESYLIASTIDVIIAQRLVRKICPDCREKYRPDKSALEYFHQSFDLDTLGKILKKERIINLKSELDKLEFWRGKGCQRCRGEGYKGRVGIFEVLEVTDKIRSLITKEAASAVIEKKARENGMLTMIEDGFIKVIQGITTIEEIMRVTKE